MRFIVLLQENTIRISPNSIDYVRADVDLNATSEARYPLRDGIEWSRVSEVVIQQRRELRNFQRCPLA